MYTLADMLVQISNAQNARHETVMIPFSNVKKAVATLLQKSGMVAEVEDKKKKIRKSEFPYIEVKLKPDGFRKIKIISKPSRRVYRQAEELNKVRSGYGIS